MARRPIQLGSAAERDIATRTARGESAETIKSATRVSVSARTIRRRQATLRGKNGSRGRTGEAPPTKARPTVPEHDHEALRFAYGRAETMDDVRRCARELLLLERPRFAQRLDEGASLPEALADDDPAVLDLLASVEGVVYLAQRATEDVAPFGYEPEPGESPEAFERAMASIHKAERRRAVALLETALEVLRGRQ